MVKVNVERGTQLRLIQSPMRCLLTI